MHIISSLVIVIIVVLCQGFILVLCQWEVGKVELTLIEFVKSIVMRVVCYWCVVRQLTLIC